MPGWLTPQRTACASTPAAEALPKRTVYMGGVTYDTGALVAAERATGRQAPNPSVPADGRGLPGCDGRPAVSPRPLRVRTIQATGPSTVHPSGIAARAVISEATTRSQPLP